MTEPHMVVVPEDAGETARRRGLIGPIETEETVEPSTNGSHPPQPGVKVVTLAEFTSTHEEAADPLIGGPDDSLLPADGLLLMYGDGGAGKTTLSIDALAHLASGTEWLGMTIPAPIRILLIENEGPRGPFRLRLANKIASWTGAPFAPNVNVLEEPWTRFTLTDPDYRKAIADEITRTETDLVMVGPLASLGAKGTGTPDEINEFDALVADMRSHTNRRFALWIVHHENKSGDVSGAWERYPDSLVHIQGQGNGRTRIHWRKIRWSSSLHGTSSNLVWAQGNSFELEIKPERDRRAELLEKLDDGEWKGITSLSQGSRREITELILTQLKAEGIVETISPIPGRAHNSIGWRLVPLVPGDRTSNEIGSSGASGRAGQANLLDPGEEPLVPPVRPYKGQAERDERATQGTARPPVPDEQQPDEHDQAMIDALEAERLEALYGDEA